MKTTEDAAREAVRKEYLCEKCAYQDDCDFCGGENTAFDCCECPADSYEDGFKVGAAYIMSLPLCDRLTSEEREKIKGFYDGETFGELDFIELISCRRILENIFGTAMFEEK